MDEVKDERGMDMIKWLNPFLHEQGFDNASFFPALLDSGKTQ